MSKKINPILGWTLSILFWLILWEIFARIIDFSFIIPTATETILTFCNLLFTKSFIKSIFFSLLRIAAGYILGLVCGVSLGLLTHKYNVAKWLTTPLMVLTRATPVASFIMILWFLLSGGMIPIIIGLLMVLPVIWQSTKDGLDNISQELIEVSQIFGFSFKKRMRLLVFPSLKSFLFPAVITSSGLAWKAGIAAEIITYTKNSIGEQIKNSKDTFEGAYLFAWTLSVIILSVIIELVIKKLLTGTRKS